MHLPAETAFFALGIAALLLVVLFKSARSRNLLGMLVASVASLGAIVIAFQTGVQIIATSV